MDSKHTNHPLPFALLMEYLPPDLINSKWNFNLFWLFFVCCLFAFLTIFPSTEVHASLFRKVWQYTCDLLFAPQTMTLQDVPRVFPTVDVPDHAHYTIGAVILIVGITGTLGNFMVFYAFCRYLSFECLFKCSNVWTWTVSCALKHSPGILSDYFTGRVKCTKSHCCRKRVATCHFPLTSSH